jgi:hypothetical protein
LRSIKIALYTLIPILYCMLLLVEPSYACACEGENPNNFYGYIYLFIGVFIFGGISILTLLLVVKIWRERKRPL